MKKSNMKSLIIWRTACILLFFTLITTHFSAALPARYTSTASGSDSARVAKFEGGTVSCNNSFNIKLESVINFDSYWTDTEKSSKTIKYFAINIDFQVTFDDAEVARKYILDLAIAPYETIDTTEKTSFKCPESTIYTINVTTNTASNTANYETDKVYCTLSNSTNVTLNTPTTTDTTMQLTGYVPVGAHECTFTVTYFVPMYYITTPAVERKAETDIIAYNFVCEQVD